MQIWNPACRRPSGILCNEITISKSLCSLLMTQFGLQEDESSMLTEDTIDLKFLFFKWEKNFDGKIKKISSTHSVSLCNYGKNLKDVKLKKRSLLMKMVEKIRSSITSQSHHHHRMYLRGRKKVQPSLETSPTWKEHEKYCSPFSPIDWCIHYTDLVNRENIKRTRDEVVFKSNSMLQ